MGWVTPEQLERARLVPVLNYILSRESGDFKRVGREYRHKKHSSLAVGEKGWYWHSKEMGSWSALDYLVDVKGYGLVEAVCEVLGERAQERSGSGKPVIQSGAGKPTSSLNKAVSKPRPPPDAAEPPAIAKSEQPPPEQTLQTLPFALPLRNKDNSRVIAYLQSRGIDRDLILACINRGVLFESRYYHNAVFLGKDEKGKTRFAAMRSISNGFMRDADGSDKRYGFVLPPVLPNPAGNDYAAELYVQGLTRNTDLAGLAVTHDGKDNSRFNTVIIFESPIDCLSHQTLYKQGYLPPIDGWRLSLGGTSLLALEHFLEQNPDVSHCVIATDNDEAGDLVAEKIAEIAATPETSPISGITTERSRPIGGDDWNYMLQAVKREEREQNRVRGSPYL